MDVITFVIYAGVLLSFLLLVFVILVVLGMIDLSLDIEDEEDNGDGKKNRKS